MELISHIYANATFPSLSFKKNFRLKIQRQIKKLSGLLKSKRRAGRRLITG